MLSVFVIFKYGAEGKTTSRIETLGQCRQQSVLNSTEHATRDYTVVKFFLGACTPFLVSLSFSLFTPRELDFFETLTSHLSSLWIIDEVLRQIRTLTWPYAIFQWMRAVLLAFVDLITRAPLSFLENVRKAVVSRWVTKLCCSVTFALATPKN